MVDFSLNNKTALITGAGSGIGRELAKQLAAAGCHLALCDLDEAGLLDYVLHDLAGVILRKPVYEMMGAKSPTAIDIYSGAIYMDDLMPTDNPAGIEAVLAACRMDYDAGYRAFKLKIGRGRKWMPRAEGDRVNRPQSIFRPRYLNALAHDGQ